MTSENEITYWTGGNVERVIALIMAFVPVVMMYKVPLANISVASAVIVIAAPVFLLVALRRLYAINAGLFLIGVLYFGYLLSKSGGSLAIVAVSVLCVFIGLLSDAVDAYFFRKAVELVSVVAAICVILQTIIHFVSGVHLPLINYSLCTDGMSQYRQAILTGYSEAEYMYRPSAFFLEPSHMATYCLVGLLSCLFQSKVRFWSAAVISAGLILSTSGIGMILCASTWVFYILFGGGAKNVSARVRRIIVGFLLASILLLFLMQTEVFYQIIARFTGDYGYSDTQYNAIWGRTMYWDAYISPMSGADLVFGYGSSAKPDVYFTGIMELLFCYGFIGALLYYLLHFALFFSSGVAGKYLCIVLVAMSFVANLTGLVFISFFLTSIIVISKNQSLSKRLLR